MKLKRVAGWGAGAIVAASAAAFAIAYVRSSNECYDPGLAPPVNPMQAVVYCEYGPPDVLRLESVEKPKPSDDEILVHVRAVSVNPLDWHYVRGAPYLMRLGTGLRRPKSIRLGVDFSGTVEEAGKNVTRFKPGDDVFGGQMGAFAEYVCVRGDGNVAQKPAALTFEEAASLPIAAITALQALRDEGMVGPGKKVLINGASGGVGTFSVQIAKALGATVAGVCSTRNVDLVRSLGADRVFDYTREDFAASEDRYDVLLDNVGNRSLSDCRRVLKPDGRYILVGGGGTSDQGFFGPIAWIAQTFLVDRFVSQKVVMFMAKLNKDDLAVLGGLVEAGRVKPVIDRRYALRDIAEAMRYLETGRARGKVVIDVE